jgi:homocysteine S-methyltransferase
LEERLGSGPALVLDGAMGTELQRRGVPMHDVAWCGAALEHHADVVRAVHADYVRAGAEVLITNTFAASRHVLAAAGFDDQAFARLNGRAVALAAEARDAVARHPVWIAGAISTFAAANPRRRLPERHGLAADCRAQAEILAAAGADVIVVEMVRDIDEGVLQVQAAAAAGLPVWAGFSCRLGADGATVLLWGEDRDLPLAQALAPLRAAGATAAGVMHSRFEVTAPALAVLAAGWPGRRFAYPHRGRFVMPEWRFEDAIGADAFALAALSWVDGGARLVGGCCGIGPEHIATLAARLWSGIGLD